MNIDLSLINNLRALDACVYEVQLDMDLNRSDSTIPCVQEVVTPFYIVTYYIKWGNYFLGTQ